MFEKKPNFILLIGSDGSGKSTIAAGLNKILGYEVHHFGPPKDYEDGRQQYFSFIEKTNTNVVCDRFHEGEAIFAPIYRGYTADYFDELEQKLVEKFNVLLVLVRAPYYIIEERLIKRGEDFVKQEDWGRAYDAVNSVYHNSNLPKVIIDTDKFTIEENIRQLISII